MIGDDAAQMLAQYRAGLEAQIALLRQLEAVASTQRTVSESRDFERLAIESDRRDSLTRSLVEIEQGLAAGLRVLGLSGWEWISSHASAVRRLFRILLPPPRHWVE